VEEPALLVRVLRISSVEAGGGAKKPSLSFTPGVTGEDGPGRERE